VFRVLSFLLIVSAGALVAASPPEDLPSLGFEPNHGQAPAQVKWIARGPGHVIFLTREGVTMRIEEAGCRTLPTSTKYSMVQMKLAGGRAWRHWTGLEPKGSRRDSPQYEEVKVAGVYDGVDVVFHSRAGGLQYDFVVAPGADPGNIRMIFSGVRRLRVDEESGDLILTTGLDSEVRQPRPKVYQETGGQRVEIPGGYELLEDGSAAFSLAADACVGTVSSARALCCSVAEDQRFAAR
jgi:hypothetical protein